MASKVLAAFARGFVPDPVYPDTERTLLLSMLMLLLLLLLLEEEEDPNPPPEDTFLRLVFFLAQRAVRVRVRVAVHVREVCCVLRAPEPVPLLMCDVCDEEAGITNAFPRLSAKARKRTACTHADGRESNFIFKR